MELKNFLIIFEFKVLEKVKHENIVKLLAIEEEQEGRGKVGNLFSFTKLRYLLAHKAV